MVAVSIQGFASALHGTPFASDGLTVSHGALMQTMNALHLVEDRGDAAP